MSKTETKHRPDHFETIDQSLSPHPSKARILIEINDKPGLETALNVLQNMGLDNVEHFIPWQEHPDRVLLHVDIEDVKEAVLRLSEAGFNRVKGINPGKTKVV